MKLTIDSPDIRLEAEGYLVEVYRLIDQDDLGGREVLRLPGDVTDKRLSERSHLTADPQRYIY